MGSLLECDHVGPALKLELLKTACPLIELIAGIRKLENHPSCQASALLVGHHPLGLMWFGAGRLRMGSDFQLPEQTGDLVSSPD